MVVSECLSKWVMLFYPPFFFQRIWVVGFDKGFRGVNVKINKSFFNRNYNNSIFGGTIFSAADPFFPILFYQVLTNKGHKVIAWSKSAGIQFLKPGLSKLRFSINLSDEDITEAEQILYTAGKYVKTHPIDIYNETGEVCVVVTVEVYVRNLNFIESDNETVFK